MAEHIAASALDLIGATPMIALDRLYRGPGRIFAKAEFLNPGGSIKDRGAKAILCAARADGRLQLGQLVVEMTSGNMGAGLAVACAALGHPLVVTMSVGNSPARARMLEALGAEVILVPQVDGVPGEVTGNDVARATTVATCIVRERGGFYVDQFNAAEGVVAHAQTTGPEIWTQLGGQVDAWVAGVGTGATFLGVAAYLKEKRRDILCAAVEPAGCEPLSGRPVAKARHVLQGMGYGTTPPHWRSDLCDQSITVTDAEAAEWKMRLAREEGLHVGFSAAANVCAAIKLAEQRQLCRVVTVLCDTGLKY